MGERLISPRVSIHVLIPSLQLDRNSESRTQRSKPAINTPLNLARHFAWYSDACQKRLFYEKDHCGRGVLTRGRRSSCVKCFMEKYNLGAVSRQRPGYLISFAQSFLQSSQGGILTRWRIISYPSPSIEKDNKLPCSCFFSSPQAVILPTLVHVQMSIQSCG